MSGAGWGREGRQAGGRRVAVLCHVAVEVPHSGACMGNSYILRTRGRPGIDWLCCE